MLPLASSSPKPNGERPLTMKSDPNSIPPGRRLVPLPRRSPAFADPGAPELCDMRVDSLRPNKHKTKKHPKEQIEKLANGIIAFGFVGVVVVNSEQRVLAGHARLEAAKRAGLVTVPCMVVRHLSAAAQRAFMLADNKLA